MSKPRYHWWGYARAIIRDYPALATAEADLHQQRLTATYTGMPSGKGGTGHGLEDIVAKHLPECKQRELDAVRSAIETTRKMPTGADRLSLIDLCYWRSNDTLETAAYKIHVHQITAKRWHVDFVRLVGKNMGFMDGLER